MFLGGQVLAVAAGARHAAKGDSRVLAAVFAVEGITSGIAGQPPVIKVQPRPQVRRGGPDRARIRLYEVPLALIDRFGLVRMVLIV